MTTTASAIEARGLVRRFGDKEAVAGIDLAVASGEIFGFLGPNGAVKSTTVRMLTTLLSPSDGTASVAGFNIDTEADDVRLRIGVALQEAALDPKQTGRELLDMQGRLYGLPKDVRLRRVDELLQLVNIGDSIDDRIATYSGGMKRRLDLAAALVHQPEVLFLDEPTTGLDPTSRAAVWDEVRYLNKQLGITIFLTTQYLEEADELADRVGIIARGKIVAEGTPDELKRSIGADVIIAKVGSGDGARAAQVLAALSDLDSVEVSGDQLVIATAHGASAISPVAVTLSNNSIKVSELTLRTPTLDDVFLHTTGSRMDANEEESVTA
ncbi:MAG: ATP-binding cassette domain-containing protein [Actinomycetota bacterium]